MSIWVLMVVIMMIMVVVMMVVVVELVRYSGLYTVVWLTVLTRC